MEQNQNQVQEPVVQEEAATPAVEQEPVAEPAVEQEPPVQQKIPTAAPAPAVQTPKLHGIAIAALICGIVGFFINPAYLVTLAAIILGIIGLIIAQGAKNKVMAGIGIGCGVVSFFVQLIVDIILSIFTFGLSFLI